MAFDHGAAAVGWTFNTIAARALQAAIVIRRIRDGPTAFVQNFYKVFENSHNRSNPYSHRHRRLEVRGTRVASAAVRRVSASVVSVHAVPETVPRLAGSVPPSGQRREVRHHLLRDHVLVSEPSVRK